MQDRAQAVQPATARKLFVRLIPFLVVLYVVAFLDRVNVGFAALQMNADLGFSATQFGVGSAMFFVGYCLAEVPSNLILARIGARLWIARIMITLGPIGRDAHVRPHSDAVLCGAIFARCCRSGLLPRRRFLAKSVVSGGQPRPRDWGVHDRNSTVGNRRRPAVWRDSWTQRASRTRRLAMVVLARRAPGSAARVRRVPL